MGGLAALGRPSLAPDTAGNGDSEPLAMAQPEIPELARAALAAVETRHAGPFHLYGSHTGASIAMEIALARPNLVRTLTIEGMGVGRLPRRPLRALAGVRTGGHALSAGCPFSG